MIIGYDAKRAFQNKTGLGNYSRTLLHSLNNYFEEHQYLLFAPKESSLFNTNGPQSFQVITPEWQPAKKLPSLWRSWWMTRDLKKTGIQLYHGLSNEIPAGIESTNIRSVVTIHDLIFERYPHQYDRMEVWMYKRKFRQACRKADAIIATSQQTKNDIIDFYQVPADKIHVCYQSCTSAYWEKLPSAELSAIRQQYNLPANYFLYVGSITERKRLMMIARALHLMRYRLDIPLVVVGEGKTYKKEVQQWLERQGLSNRVIFLSETDAARNSPGYQSGLHFPAIYQNATAFIYPSSFEGFGIPVLEALNSGIPVITTNASSLPEVGGKAALYFEPYDLEGLCDAMWRAATNETIRQQSIRNAAEQVLHFTPKKCAASVMKVYQTLL